VPLLAPPHGFATVDAFAELYAAARQLEHV
jgi:hypothetical protein